MESDLVALGKLSADPGLESGHSQTAGPSDLSVPCPQEALTGLRPGPTSPRHKVGSNDICLPGQLLKWGGDWKGNVHHGHFGGISAIAICTVMAGPRTNVASFYTLLVHPREHCHSVKMEEAPSPTDRAAEPPSPERGREPGVMVGSCQLSTER